jgi:hypothetical protein
MACRATLVSRVASLDAPTAAITTGLRILGTIADGGTGGAGGWAEAPLAGRKFAGTAVGPGRRA